MAGARPLRIVVVDNDPDALALAVTDLRYEGHDIVGEALDGETALQLVESERPDVLVIDHRMPPGPWGLEVAERLAQLAFGTRVIVYSNYQSVELIKRVRAAGATFLPKGNLRSLRRAVGSRQSDQATSTRSES
jgi:CheY-like chemotaxis protein